MTDLISRDAAIDRIDKCVALSGIGCEPVMAIRDIKALISVLPAVEAVPVEWLNQKYAENEPGEEKDYDYFLWDAITYVLTKWQNEQGARWWLISCGR